MTDGINGNDGLLACIPHLKHTCKSNVSQIDEKCKQKSPDSDLSKLESRSQTCVYLMVVLDLLLEGSLLRCSVEVNPIQFSAIICKLVSETYRSLTLTRDVRYVTLI